jgi:hypothetical protein
MRERETCLRKMQKIAGDGNLARGTLEGEGNP